MKDSIAEIKETTDELMNLAGRFDRGQIIPWHDVEAIAGDRRDNRGKHIITKWRKRLEQEREIVTLAADGVGVRLLTHRETATEIPRIRQRKAYRQIRRGLKQTQTIDPSQLSDHERRLLVAQQHNMADARRDLFRSQRQAIEGAKPTETTPRRLTPLPSVSR